MVNAIFSLLFILKFNWLMMAIAFLGYVLPYGQMSLWGATVNWPNFLIKLQFHFMRKRYYLFYYINN